MFGAWDDATQFFGVLMSTTRAGTVSNRTGTETSITDNWDVLVLHVVSDPIPAQTVSGTLDWLMGVQESNAAMNAHWHIYAYVEDGAGAERGVLYADYTEALGTNEWPTTLTALGPTGPITLTPIAAQNNDRIVIEVGFVSRNTDATSFTGTIARGGSSGIELISGGDPTLYTGWFQFSQDLFPPVRSRHRPHRSATNDTADTLSFLGEEYTEWT